MTPSVTALLAWYDRSRRTLPWRALPGQASDPYRVWLSEIMLQQTTVTAVIPYYTRFLERFPDIQSLAQAGPDEVLSLWSGLGYYSRARNLHRCAQEVAARGGFPADLAALQSLPGIGPYTAAAIGAIAFGLPVVPVDGNVERVTARVFAVEAPLPGARRELAVLAARFMETEEARCRPGDVAQALFDLGAGLCTPRSPGCVLCPWRESCAGLASGLAASLPRKAPKKTRPERFGVHFLLRDTRGDVLLRRRPPSGLLGGTYELPGTEWREQEWSREEALQSAPLSDNLAGGWKTVRRVKHIFTHFCLNLDVMEGQYPDMTPGRKTLTGHFFSRDARTGLALSSLMVKCLGTEN
ncbi:A/G-specific adenine glycosylase [Acetobacter sp. AN02]|uniref:A/G-specific adenine glycosylase n=1 Tax=Acetobacter sp. AN02 TaxID=2894186 RepID=UPI0024342B89|nr:A/G-specific adenine glycosylase [Acetobacter sp. AN02]MDG6095456.1 A/G-specific adenine glycosylase [Acetobacter sp. AN02]